MSSPYSPR